jgi:hypothetical protein
MNFKLKLLAISRLLGSVPSILYGLTYLALIPIFAGAYYGLPAGNFYHATLLHEAPLSTQFRTIEYDLSRAVFQQFNENATSHHRRSRGTYAPDDWGISINDVNNVRVNEKQVSFQVEAEVWGNKSVQENIKLGQYQFASITVGITFNLDPNRGTDNSDALESRELTFEMSPEVTSVFTDRKSQSELQYALFPINPAPGTIAFPLPRRLLNEMRSYAIGTKGIGSDEGNYWRMLYLSAVTITTLGFGDIVPMTTPARILVSSEAIFGVVLVGLFLNALSFERARVERLDRAERLGKMKLRRIKK